MELVVARIDELRLRLTEAFERWAGSASAPGATADKEDVGARPQTCALSGGATALIFLGALKNANVDWSRISLFWADERAVAPEDPDSNYGIADRMLLQPLGAKAPRAFPMAFDASLDRPGLSSLGTAAMKYDMVLSRELKGRGLDLALLGVGEDGHICSLFPGHRALLADDLSVIAVEDAPKPPPRRLTLSLPFVLRTRKIWLIAVGPRKLPVLNAALSRTQRITPLDLLMQRAKDVTVFTDQIIRRA